jgi:hypothetical protein
MKPEDARNIKARHSRSLMEVPGVCGVSLQEDASGKPQLVLLVDQATDVSGLPTELEGLSVAVERAGPFKRLMRG